MGELFIDIIKVGTVTLVTSKIVKAIGQTDMSDIIRASGLTICGVDAVMILVPVVKGIQNFNEKLGMEVDTLNKGIQGFCNLLDKLTFWN